MQHYQDVLQDRSGNAIAGAIVTVLYNSTSLPADLYSDYAGTQPLTSIVTDADGSYSFYVSSGRYDYAFYKNGKLLKTQNDVFIDQSTALQDLSTPSGASMVGFNPTGTVSAPTVQTAIAELDTDISNGLALKTNIADLAATTGASLVGFQQTGTGSVARTVDAKVKENVSVLDFGADPTGVANSTTAFANAMATIATEGEIDVPEGTYTLTPASLTIGSKVIKWNAYGARLPADMPGTVIQNGSYFYNVGWSGDSPRPQTCQFHVDLGNFPAPVTGRNDAVYTVKGYALDNSATQPAGTKEIGAYNFDMETNQQDTSSVIRGLHGNLKANGGSSTVRAVRVLCEGVDGHNGELTGVLSTVIHTDLCLPDKFAPAPYNPVSGTAFQAELGAGTERGFLCTGWPGQSIPQYAFVVGTGSRAVLPEIACYSAHGGGNGDLFQATTTHLSATISYAVDNKGRTFGRSFYSGLKNINNDAVVTITAPQAVGFVEIWDSAAAGQIFGKAYYKATTGPFCTNCYKGTSVTFTTGVLTGTTGAVGQVSISPQVDGTIMIENRSGGARNILFHFVAQSNTAGSFI